MNGHTKRHDISNDRAKENIFNLSGQGKHLRIFQQSDTTFPSCTYSILIKETIKILLVFAYLFASSTAYSQSLNLFDSNEILELTLRGDLKTLFNDRGDDPQYHNVYLQYQDDQITNNIPIKIKVRGNFRKKSSNCGYPPLLLNFAKSTTPKKSVFWDQNKLKLVTSCRGDEYVVHEYLVYKLYNLLTPKSFKVRLVKVIYDDTVKNKSSDPQFGMLIEDEDQMANRNLCTSVKKNGLRPADTQKNDFLKMAVFQFMIGNTDWSVQYRQNIKLIAPDSTARPITVPYDFDHAGIVRATYANPAPELKLSSTLERRYRGYCISDMDQFTPIFDIFNQLKSDFYALYDGNPLLGKGYQKQTLKFIDQFYETINNPKKAEDAFTYPCDPSGTGNVVIKGLKEDN